MGSLRITKRIRLKTSRKFLSALLSLRCAVTENPGHGFKINFSPKQVHQST